MKYKPRFIWSVLAGGGVALGFLIALPVGISKNPSMLNEPLLYLAILLATFFALYPFLGLRIGIKDSNLYRRDFFLWTSSLMIKDIRSILYHNSFVIGGSNKTVSVFDTNGKKIFMESMPFGKEMQRDLIKNLVRLNPAIRLNDEAQDLVRDNK